MQYKDGKIIQIIQEFSVLGNTYNLNGIDLINAVFFVREDRKKFRLLLPAEYKINVDGTNVNLEIQDGVLNNCISVQVGIDLNKLFDLYDPVGSPDIVVLKDKYNQLCQDMANLWEYVKKQGVSSDALNRDIVLPILKEGETYVMLNGSLEATPLVTAETELQKLLDELVEKSQEVLNGYVEALEETLKKNLLEFIESEKQNFVTFDDESTETERGIISDLDIRSREAAYILGAAYGDVFGATLTSIEKGKTYYYWYSMKKTYIPYEALTTSAKSGGFITPDVNNFKNISNSYLAKIVEDIDGFRLTIDKQEKLLKVFRYDRSSGGNTKTMKWVYNQILLFIKKHKYDLLNNTFISGYSIHQASNIQASYSTYYDEIFICHQTAGNQLVNTEQWYFHTGEMIIPIA